MKLKKEKLVKAIEKLTENEETKMKDRSPYKLAQKLGYLSFEEFINDISIAEKETKNIYKQFLNNFAEEYMWRPANARNDEVLKMYGIDDNEITPIVLTNFSFKEK